MLDIKRIREDFDNIKAKVESRGNGDFEIDQVIVLDNERREILVKVEKLKNQQKTDSKQIPVLKKNGGNVDALMEEMKQLAEEIKVMDERVSVIEAELKDRLLNIPNAPHESNPVGTSDADNAVYRVWGEPTAFDFEAKAHWDVGMDLGILDFERATKIAGTRFTIYKGLGAKLERALINFMLDLHTEQHGYTEILPPFMVNRAAMTGTGQLPKFEDDMLPCAGQGLFT